MKTRVQRLFSASSICLQCRLGLPRRLPSLRTLTSTAINRAEDPPPSDPPPTKPTLLSSLSSLTKAFSESRQQQQQSSPLPPRPGSSTSSPPSPSSRDTSDVDSLADLTPAPSTSGIPPRPPVPHHLHVYAHNHNTHITLTTPARDALINVSTGKLNFRKAQRGTYDAAYQLGKYVMERIVQQGLLREIQYLQVVLRDFGPGREAVVKVLLGAEGRILRGRIVSVTDATRVKFGGTRSKKPRRLG